MLHFFGGSLFLYAHLSEISHLQDFFKNKLSLTAFGLSTLLLFFQWHYIKKNREKKLRFFGVAQLTLIFLGWMAVQFPYVYNNHKMGVSLNIYKTVAPVETLRHLMIALTIGVILIIPPYLYLLHIFKRNVKK